MYKLTIGIPTYNRNDILLKTVQRISQQLKDNVELLIIDNNSNIPVSETLRQIKKENIRIIKNKTNIGGNANVLRCAEEAKGEYLWCLGDDDLPTHNALKSILDILESDKNILWLNFKSNDPINQPLRYEQKKIYEFVNFLKSLNSISELVFISNNVLKTELIQQGIDFGHDHLEKNFPIGVAAFCGILRNNQSGSYLIENIDLFEKISNITNEKEVLPYLPIYVRIMRLIQLPFPQDISVEILKLVRGARKSWLSNKFIMVGLSSYIKDKGRKRALMHNCDLIISIIIIDKFKSIATILLLILVMILGSNYIKMANKLNKK